MKMPRQLVHEGSRNLGVPDNEEYQQLNGYVTAIQTRYWRLV